MLVAKGSNLGNKDAVRVKSNLSSSGKDNMNTSGKEPWGRGKKKNQLKLLNEDLLLMNELMKLPDNLSGKNLPLAPPKPPSKPQYQLPERLLQQFQTFKEEHESTFYLPSIPNCRCCP